MTEPKLRRMTQKESLAWHEHQDRLYELVDGCTAQSGTPTHISSLAGPCSIIRGKRSWA